MTYVAIMAGGVGSRFWPGSRESRPKQFMDMMGTGKSLLRLTFERFLPICPAENILVVTNSMYKKLVMKHLPEIGEHQVLCEPSRNNTAPCVAYTAFKTLGLDPNANLVIAPADHLVLKEAAFLTQIQKCLAFAAEKEAILTLGIQPTRPDTGYGYINFGAEAKDGVFAVKKFTEKPDYKTAQKFVKSGKYLWNAGIFISRSSTLLKAYKKFAPEIYNILAAGKKAYNTKKEQDFINEAYPTTPNIAVDVAIMEKAKNVFTVPADIGWSDLGTWASLYSETEKKANGNVVNSEQILLENTEDCLIRLTEGKMAVIRGLKDFIVVDDDDVLLIYPKNKEQDIKTVTNKLKKPETVKFL